MATLHLKKVYKMYGDLEVIHGIDMAVAHGEFVVFVGPSGCGKSTLLRMIAGLEEISRGEIEIDHERVNDVPAAQRGLAMVFQSYALYPHMSVRQNLSFGLENLRMPKKEIQERVEAAARMLQIEPYLHRRPGALSGGQRQRVAIGRAVVREPKIFLFDEPLSNLDAELRVQMRVEISSLHQRLGNTMIYVTHDQVEAMTMADKIAVLRQGQVEQFGAPIELYNHPANRFVAGFIGSPRMNFLAGEIAEISPTHLTLRLNKEQMLKVPVASPHGIALHDKIDFGIRPEHLCVTSPEQGSLQAVVTTVEQLGGESYLYCHLSEGEKLTLHLSGQTQIQRNDVIGLIMEEHLIYLFHPETGAVLPRSLQKSPDAGGSGA